MSAALGRFAFRWSRFSRLPVADRTLIRSIWVFLAPGRFAAKTPDHEGWYSLDFLGFLSSESRLFNGLRSQKREKVYRTLFLWRSQRRNGSPRSRPCGSAGLFMGRA